MKKVLLMCVSMILVAALSIGGTLAYLTSTDSAVNVMTVGNVKINQIEYERVKNADGSWKKVDGKYVLQEFTQDKPILPIGGAVTGWDNVVWNDLIPEANSKIDGTENRFLAGISNSIDKIVTVKNTGNSKAYFRTIIAIEDPVGAEGIIMTNASPLDYDWDWETVGQQSAATGTRKEIKDVMIDGTRFRILVATYQKALEPGEVARPSLIELYMKGKEATNEIVALFGETLNVLAYTQAVQADGFATPEEALEAAYGSVNTINADNNPWTGFVLPMTVSSADDIEAAVAAGAGAVKLTTDVTLDEQLEVKGDLTIYGDGNTLTVPASGTRVINVADNDEDVKVTLSGVTLDAANKERGISFYNNSGALDVVIEDSKINVQHYGINVASGNEDAELVVSDSTITGFCAFQTWSANTKATFNNCTLEGINQWAEDSGVFATIVINNGADNSVLTFNNCTVIATETNTAVEYHLIDNSNNSVVNWNGCTFIYNDNGTTTTTNTPIVK